MQGICRCAGEERRGEARVLRAEAGAAKRTKSSDFSWGESPSIRPANYITLSLASERWMDGNGTLSPHFLREAILSQLDGAERTDGLASFL